MSLKFKKDLGGILGLVGSDMDMGKMISGGVNQITSSIGTDINQDFLRRNKNIEAQFGIKNSLSQASDALSTKLLGSGNPTGMIVGGAMQLGKGLLNSSTDEYGVFNKGEKWKGILGTALNPIKGVSTLLNQKKLGEAKNQYLTSNVRSASVANRQSAIANQSQYQPVPYGKFGRKLTKFSKQ